MGLVSLDGVDALCFACTSPVGSFVCFLYQAVARASLTLLPLNRPYTAGFRTMIESDTFPKGLDEDVVRAISAKKGEPEWMLDFRLKAYRKWLTMAEPVWSDNRQVEDLSCCFR